MTTIPFTTDQSTWVGIDIAKKHNDVLIERPRRRRQHFKVANQLEDYRRFAKFLGDLELPNDLGRTKPFRQLDLRASKLPNDLLCRVPFPSH